MNPAKATRFAHKRIRSLLLPGMKSRTARPARGVIKMMVSKCWSIGLPHNVIAEEHQNPDHHEKRVSLHPPGLNDADRVGEHLHEERSEAHRAVDHPRIPPRRDRSREPRKPSRAVDAAIHHVAIEGSQQETA